MKYDNLGDVLKDIQEGNIRDEDILTNKDTGERVIVKDGSLHFLTANDYVSNEVPLVRGMILATWEHRALEYKEVTIEGAMKYLLDGVNIIVQKPIVVPSWTEESEWEDLGTVNTVEDFIELLGMEYYVGSLKGFSFLVKEEDVDDDTSNGRKTTETEAWAILMDRNFHGFTAKEIAGKYGISLRNVYYIIDGTYYTDVYERFNQLVETGELY